MDERKAASYLVLHNNTTDANSQFAYAYTGLASAWGNLMSLNHCSN